METFEDFDAAAAACGDGETVCGTYRGEQPVYFVAKRGLPDDEYRDMAFEIREGRRPSEYENFLLAMAKQLRPESEPVPA